MSGTHSGLDQEELLHLAIEATRRGEHGAAISYLKEGIVRFPKDGKLAYVLGAEFAQIGMYDKAEEEMGRAIELDPTLYTASFQLGLLRMTLGKIDGAKTAWSILDKLAEGNPLRLFKNGLELLATEEYQEARILLEQGIALNNFSPELNRDMQNVLSAIPATDGTVNQESTANRTWLSAYHDHNKAD